jgi:hypothetical protein
VGLKFHTTTAKIRPTPQNKLLQPIENHPVIQTSRDPSNMFHACGAQCLFAPPPNSLDIEIVGTKWAKDQEQTNWKSKTCCCNQYNLSLWDMKQRLVAIVTGKGGSAQAK